MNLHYPKHPLNHPEGELFYEHNAPLGAYGVREGNLVNLPIIFKKILNPMLWLLALCLTIASCQPPVAPEFEGVRNMKINVEGLAGARINGDAVFFNSNNKKIKIKGVDVEVSVDNKKVKDIAREYDITAMPNSQFTVPIDVTLSLKDLNMGLLSTAMSMLNGEEKKVRYKGKAKVQIYGVSFSVPFDYEDEVKVKL